MSDKYKWPEQSPQNEQKEAGRLAINELRSKTNLKQLPNSFTNFFNSRLSQLERQELPKSESFKQKLSNIGDEINKLTELQRELSDNPSFEQFWKLLDNLDESSIKSATSVFLTEKNEDLISDFKENWMPTKQLWLKLFWEKYQINIKFLPAQEKKEQRINNIDKANIETLTEIYNAISGNLDSSLVFDLLKQVAEWDIKAYKKLLTQLKNNPEQLKQLVSIVQDYDQKNQTHHYESSKNR